MGVPAVIDRRVVLVREVLPRLGLGRRVRVVPQADAEAPVDDRAADTLRAGVAVLLEGAGRAEGLGMRSERDLVEVPEAGRRVVRIGQFVEAGVLDELLERRTLRAAAGDVRDEAVLERHFPAREEAAVPLRSGEHAFDAGDRLTRQPAAVERPDSPRTSIRSAPSPGWGTCRDGRAGRRLADQRSAMSAVRSARRFVPSGIGDLEPPRRRPMGSSSCSSASCQTSPGYVAIWLCRCRGCPSRTCRGTSSASGTAAGADRSCRRRPRTRRGPRGFAVRNFLMASPTIYSRLPCAAPSDHDACVVLSAESSPGKISAYTSGRRSFSHFFGGSGSGNCPLIQEMA